MSTSVDHYFILGVKMDPDAFEECQDSLDPFIYGKSNRSGAIVVYDGMAGEYVVLGMKIGKGTMEEGFDDVVELNPFDQNFGRVVSDAARQINIILSECGLPHIGPMDIRLLVFSHWH